jgi:hypothetical protein
MFVPTKPKIPASANWLHVTFPYPGYGTIFSGFSINFPAPQTGHEENLGPKLIGLRLGTN